MKRMKTVIHRSGLLHIETPLGIVNIRIGLIDKNGRSVEAIDILPNRGAGDPKVKLIGRGISRLVQLKTVREGVYVKKRPSQDPLRRAIWRARKEANEAKTATQ